MVGMRESTAQQTVQYKATPADVATAVEQALASIGEVKETDAATGRISGKIKKGLKGFDSAARVDILISASGDQTEVQIQTSRDEGAMSTHGAEKGMAILLDAMQAQPTLAQGSTSGW